MVLQRSSQVVLLRKGRPRPDGLLRWQRLVRREEPHHPLGTPTLNPNRPNNPQPTATPLRQHPHHGRPLQHGSPSGGGRSRNRRRHHVRRRAADGHRGRLLVRTAQRPPAPDRRNRRNRSKVRRKGDRLGLGRGRCRHRRRGLQNQGFRLVGFIRPAAAERPHGLLQDGEQWVVRAGNAVGSAHVQAETDQGGVVAAAGFTPAATAAAASGRWCRIGR
uniref:(northern house mosquito) hypothetical protein n=1 Tax=Culex pipiens TaxID=7175 RepID=A0A8D8ARY3_CULPI